MVYFRFKLEQHVIKNISCHWREELWWRWEICTGYSVCHLEEEHEAEFVLSTLIDRARPSLQSSPSSLCLGKNNTIRFSREISFQFWIERKWPFGILIPKEFVFKEMFMMMSDMIAYCSETAHVWPDGKKKKNHVCLSPNVSDAVSSVYESWRSRGTSSRHCYHNLCWDLGLWYFPLVPLR